MATIKYAKGFKYFFDVEFTVPALQQYDTITMTDVIPAGLSFDVNDVEVKLNETPLSNSGFISTDNNGELTVVISDSSVVDMSDEDRLVTITFPVVVEDVVAFTAKQNIAHVWGDNAADKLEIIATFDAEDAYFRVETNSSEIKNVPTKQDESFEVLATLNGLDTHEVAGAEYVVTFTFAQELGSVLDDQNNHGITLKLVNPLQESDIIKFDVVAVKRTDTTPAQRIVTIPHQERFRNNQIYITVPTHLVEAVSPSLGNPARIFTEITAEFMELDAHTVHTTTITTDYVITAGKKIIY